MSRIVRIAQQSRDYISRIDANVSRVIESKEVSKFILDLNKDQFAKHQDANGKPLTHKSTGKTSLSKAYAKRTGKKKPDFLLSGAFQNEMFLTVPTLEEYFITSDNEVSPFLQENYGKIFGVSKGNQSKSQKKVNAALKNDYFNKVLATK